MSIVDAQGRPIQPKTGNWQDLSAKAKRNIVAVASGIALLAAVVTNIEKVVAAFTAPKAELVVDDIDAADDTNFPYVDVYIRNIGDQTATITAAEFVVENIVTTTMSAAPAGLSVSETYDVELNLNESLPTTVRIDNVSQVLKQEDADRIRFNYQICIDQVDTSSEDVIGSIVAISFKIRFTYSGDQIVETPLVSVQNNALMIFGQLEWGDLDAETISELRNLASQMKDLPERKTQSVNRIIRYADEMFSTMEDANGG